MKYKILHDLISIQTDGSSENHQKCIQYITDYIKKEIPQCIIKPIPTNGKDNLIIGLNIKKLKDIRTGLMLCGHLDVVEGKLQQFIPYADDNKIYGRGTSDMKGAITCYLEMVQYFNTLSYPVIMCFTCDEETNMQGIKDVCVFLKKQNIFPHLTILGEPTNNKLGISSTGIKSYKTIIHGVSAHSSVPNKGVNALYVAAKIVHSLEMIMKKMQSNKLYLNVGSLTGGGNIAVIPDKAEIEWGYRYINEKDVEETMKLYSNIISEIAKEYSETSIETIQTYEFLGYSATNNNQIHQLCHDLEVEQTHLSYTSEAGYLAEIGQSVYLFGCGNIEQAHSDNEFICIDELSAYKQNLRKLTEIYREIL